MKQKGKVLTVFRLEGGSGQEAQREEIGNSRRGGVGLPSYLPGGGNDNQSIFDKSLAAESYVDAVDICSSTFNYLYNSAFSDKTGWEFFNLSDDALGAYTDLYEYRKLLHISNGGVLQKNSLIRKPEKHRIFNEKKGELTEENISITVDYTEEYDVLFLSVRFLCKSSGDLTIGFTDTQGDYALKTKHIDQSEEWQEYELSGKWTGIGDFYLSFTGLIIVDILRLADKAYDDHRKEFRTYQSQTKQNLELMVSAINELKRMKSEYDKKIEEISKSLIEIRGEIPDVSGLETSLSELEKRVSALEKAGSGDGT